MRSAGRVDAVQVGLDLIDYLDHRPSIAACGRPGIPVTIYESVAGGVLTGKTPEQARAAWPGPVAGIALVQARAGTRRRRAEHRVRRPAPPAREHQPGVAAAIVGSHDGSHMRENAEAARLDLAEVLDEIEELIPLGPSCAGR